MSGVLLIDRETMQAPPTKQRCPACGTVAPPYGFHLNGGDLGIIGTVKYFTIFCNAELELPQRSDDMCNQFPFRPGDTVRPCILKAGHAGPHQDGRSHCGAILGVQIIEYLPPCDPAKLAALMAAMKGGPTQ